MNFKPFRDYSEHDTCNLFKINTATGAKCTPVVIANSGWDHDQLIPSVFSNLADGLNNGNTYSPRWEILPAVRKAVSGEAAIGLTLYDTKEVDQWNRSIIYNKQYQVEQQCVPSGVATVIVSKGKFTIGPFPSGENPAPGKWLGVKGTGDLGVVESKTGLLAHLTGVGFTGDIPQNFPVIGRFLGCKDSDGYALVELNCYQF